MANLNRNIVTVTFRRLLTYQMSLNGPSLLIMPLTRGIIVEMIGLFIGFLVILGSCGSCSIPRISRIRSFHGNDNVLSTYRAGTMLTQPVHNTFSQAVLRGSMKDVTTRLKFIALLTENDWFLT
jgi:hypothetical protein